jgi:hypothetical protein
VELRGELVDAFDHVWQRFRERMRGVTDDEWAWTPTDDERLSLPWRIGHLVSLLTEHRNAVWMGAGDARPLEPVGPVDTATSPADALRALDDAYARWRALLFETNDDALAAPIGDVAGPFATSTRNAFVLHILDELVHHTAEAALLRDLYAGVNDPSGQGTHNPARS